MGIALITGASSGIGSEFARVFAKQGHSLILVARRKEKLESVSKELADQYGIQAWAMDCDLAKIGSATELFQKIQGLGLSIDFLVNNAGVGSGGKFSELELTRELEIIDLNIRSLVELTHHFLPQMLKKKSGRILNVGSVAGYQPGPYMNTYSASKAFVNSFTEGLHEELRGTGVTCTLVSPGYTITEFQKSASISGFEGMNFNKALPSQVAIQGYKAMMKGCSSTIIGWLNFLGAQANRIAPRFLMRRIAGDVNKSQV